MYLLLHEKKAHRFFCHSRCLFEINCDVLLVANCNFMRPYLLLSLMLFYISKGVLTFLIDDCRDGCKAVLKRKPQ